MNRGSSTATDRSKEWKRSKPDIAVYIPKENEYTGDNEHFLVFESQKGDLLALWTQSSAEGYGDNHLVLARSNDNVNWSEPIYLAGAVRGEKGRQASWGFPVVSASGRIYVFFTRDIGKYDLDMQTTGTMGCKFSDDDGYNWKDGSDIPMPRSRFDHPDPAIPKNWIAWQKPIRDSKGRWMVGFTQWTSPVVVDQHPLGWYSRDSRCLFMRFENIDEGPDLENINITWLPLDGTGLEVPFPGVSNISVAQEPSIVLLPDNRIFCVMRTFTGYIWYSVSEDDGESWRKPEILRYHEDGNYIRQPIASCPIYRMFNGKYLLVFHNNDGYLGEFKPGDVLYNRRPAFISIGSYVEGAKQPIWFEPPKQLLDTYGITIGPKGTAEIATYPSLTEYQGKRVLWYPDRKYFLLGKVITEKML